ncbi:MAG: hypothetical protein JSR33_04345 [Proteobacteria bacterium]|nr:hypothetical protein [Pseudomonadota bacterium]
MNKYQIPNDIIGPAREFLLTHLEDPRTKSGAIGIRVDSEYKNISRINDSVDWLAEDSPLKDWLRVPKDKSELAQFLQAVGTLLPKIVCAEGNQDNIHPKLLEKIHLVYPELKEENIAPTRVVAAVFTKFIEILFDSNKPSTFPFHISILAQHFAAVEVTADGEGLANFDQSKISLATLNKKDEEFFSNFCWHIINFNSNFPEVKEWEAKIAKSKKPGEEKDREEQLKHPELKIPPGDDLCSTLSALFTRPYRCEKLPSLAEIRQSISQIKRSINNELKQDQVLQEDFKLFEQVLPLVRESDHYELQIYKLRESKVVTPVVDWLSSLECLMKLKLAEKDELKKENKSDRYTAKEIYQARIERLLFLVKPFWEEIQPLFPLLQAIGILKPGKVFADTFTESVSDAKKLSDLANFLRNDNNAPANTLQFLQGCECCLAKAIKSKTIAEILSYSTVGHKIISRQQNKIVGDAYRVLQLSLQPENRNRFNEPRKFEKEWTQTFGYPQLLQLETKLENTDFKESDEFDSLYKFCISSNKFDDFTRDNGLGKAIVLIKPDGAIIESPPSLGNSKDPKVCFEKVLEFIESLGKFDFATKKAILHWVLTVQYMSRDLVFQSLNRHCIADQKYDLPVGKTDWDSERFVITFENGQLQAKGLKNFLITDNNQAVESKEFPLYNTSLKTVASGTILPGRGVSTRVNATLGFDLQTLDPSNTYDFETRLASIGWDDNNGLKARGFNNFYDERAHLLLKHQKFTDFDSDFQLLRYLVSIHGPRNHKTSFESLLKNFYNYYIEKINYRDQIRFSNFLVSILGKDLLADYYFESKNETQRTSGITTREYKEVIVLPDMKYLPETLDSDTLYLMRETNEQNKYKAAWCNRLDTTMPTVNFCPGEIPFDNQPKTYQKGSEEYTTALASFPEATASSSSEAPSDSKVEIPGNYRNELFNLIIRHQPELIVRYQSLYSRFGLTPDCLEKCAVGIYPFATASSLLTYLGNFTNPLIQKFKNLHDHLSLNKPINETLTIYKQNREIKLDEDEIKELNHHTLLFNSLKDYCNQNEIIEIAHELSVGKNDKFIQVMDAVLKKTHQNKQKLMDLLVYILPELTNYSNSENSSASAQEVVTFTSSLVNNLQYGSNKSPFGKSRFEKLKTLIQNNDPIIPCQYKLDQQVNAITFLLCYGLLGVKGENTWYHTFKSSYSNGNSLARILGDQIGIDLAQFIPNINQTFGDLSFKQVRTEILYHLKLKTLLNKFNVKNASEYKETATELCKQYPDLIRDLQKHTREKIDYQWLLNKANNQVSYDSKLQTLVSEFKDLSLSAYQDKAEELVVRYNTLIQECSQHLGTTINAPWLLNKAVEALVNRETGEIKSPHNEQKIFDQNEHTGSVHFLYDQKNLSLLKSLIKNIICKYVQQHGSSPELIVLTAMMDRPTNINVLRLELGKFIEWKTRAFKQPLLSGTRSCRLLSACRPQSDDTPALNEVRNNLKKMCNLHLKELQPFLTLYSQSFVAPIPS